MGRRVPLTKACVGDRKKRKAKRNTRVMMGGPHYRADTYVPPTPLNLRVQSIIMIAYEFDSTTPLPPRPTKWKAYGCAYMDSNKKKPDITPGLNVDVVWCY